MKKKTTLFIYVLAALISVLLLIIHINSTEKFSNVLDSQDAERQTPHLSPLEIPTEGLHLHYKFDEITNGKIENELRDQTSDETSATTSGSPTLTEGVENKALSLDGTNDFVVVPSSNYLDELNSEITVSFWFKGSNTQSGQGFINRWDIQERKISWFADISPAGGICPDAPSIDFYVTETGSSPDRTYIRECNENFQDNEWHSYVAVFKPEEYIRLYIDGQQIGRTVGNPASIEQIYTEGNIPMIIGHGYDDSSGTPIPSYYAGSIDELRIYKRALSEDEVQILSTIPEDDPQDEPEDRPITNPEILFSYSFENTEFGGGLSGTIIDDTNYKRDPFSESLQIQLQEDNNDRQTVFYPVLGGQDTAEIPESKDLGENGEFTLEFWFKGSNFNQDQVLFSKDNENSNQRSWGIDIVDSSQNRCQGQGHFLRFYVSENGRINNETAIVASCEQSQPETFQDNQWHHLAAVFSSGDKISLYIDGQLTGVEKGQDVSQINNVFNSEELIKIGGLIEKNDNKIYQGFLDNINFHSVALTEVEINNICCQNRDGEITDIVFEINSIEDLQFAIDNPDNNFVLQTDLDLTGRNFDPMPQISRDKYFDGNDHVISGITYENPGDSQAVGFIRVNRGEIKNLRIEQANLEGKNNVGGLVGRNFGNIINSFSEDSEITGRNQVGGLVGKNDGGLIRNSGSVSNTVNGRESVGGFLGWNTLGGKIALSKSEGTEVTGNQNVGGFIGKMTDESEDYSQRIISSFATGSVSTDSGNAINHGGFVGLIQDNGARPTRENSAVVPYTELRFTRIYDSYTKASVEGGENVGGFVGLIESGGRIYNSYASNEISGTSSVGGFVGKTNLEAGDGDDNENTALIMERLYWNEDSSRTSDTAGRATPRSQAQMSQEGNTLRGFDFVATWSSADGGPKLQWENANSNLIMHYPLKESSDWHTGNEKYLDFSTRQKVSELYDTETFGSHGIITDTRYNTIRDSGRGSETQRGESVYFKGRDSFILTGTTNSPNKFTFATYFKPAEYTRDHCVNQFSEFPRRCGSVNLKQTIITKDHPSNSRESPFEIEILDPSDDDNDRILQIKIIGANGNAVALTPPQTLTEEDWYHLALTFEDRNAKLYLNGQEVASTRTNFVNLAQNGNNYILGAKLVNLNREETEQGFYGDMYDVRLYNRVLSQNQITNLARFSD